MNLKLVLVILLLPLASVAQVYQSHAVQKDKISIRIADGTLTILPLSDYAVRIRLQKGIATETPEIVLVNKAAVPVFKVLATSTKVALSTKAMTVNFDKRTGSISYADASGKIFLSEKAGSRKLIPGQVAGEPCFEAEQTFISPENEYLFGLGQFQDGLQ